VTTFAFVLIGAGHLPIRCAELLNARGHRIRAFINPDGGMRSWAEKTGVPHHKLDDAVGLKQIEFDILLSVGNFAVIPDALLARAKRISVNYHYGPLPEYSGLHVPSWAIFEGAADYAITWHRIGKLVDGGNILKRVQVPIEAADTALSLGLKCDEAAFESFGALLADFEEGSVSEIPQELGRRRYFSRLSQFPAEGVIDWSAGAEQIAALVRAADYGRFVSPLVWPKVLIDSQFFAVRRASIGPPTEARHAGEVVCQDESSALYVATATRSVRLEALSSLEGEMLALRDVTEASMLQAGVRLVSPSEQSKAHTTKAGIAASKAAPYWCGRLQDYAPYRLPYALPLSSQEGAVSPLVVRLHVPPKDLEREISFIEYVMGTWCTFLARASGIAEVHLAIAAQRDEIDQDYRDLFCAWVPLLARIDASATLGQNVLAVCDELKSVRGHGMIRRDSIGRDPNFSKRFQRGEFAPDVMISWDQPTACPSAEQRPPLELVILPAQAVVEFHHNPKKMWRQNAVQLASQFAEWSSRLTSETVRPLQSLAIVSGQERAVLIEDFNATGSAVALGSCVHRLFESAARLYPSKVALLCGDIERSYKQLNADANRLARVLRQKGVGRGHLVGVCLDRSIDLIVALLAVLKAGAAYVPVDLAFPAERIRQMIEIAEPVLLLTPAGSAGSLGVCSDRCLSIDEARSEAANHVADNFDTSVTPGELAYIIFTSGSTGKPKGVEVTHAALSNFLLSMRDRPGCAEGDRLLAITTISFDIAALELFLPLICGASVVIARPQEAMDGDALLGLMRRHGVTMMQATPVTWQMLLHAGWQGRPSLSKILCGGEALSRPLADRLLSCGETVWNMYGPTETTVWSSVWQVCGGGDIVIGTPIANTQLYVLDANLLPVPVGFPGELCIGGAGVARGYHKDPELTRSRFIPNPFHPGVLYRTGDLACFKEPSKLAVLGRNDGQIKLRGLRIELGDIEAAISSHPAISHGVVVGRDDQLVAYCLRNAAPSPDAGWTGAWDHADEANVDDPTFNVSGRPNSYDGLAFSSEEMRDWQKNKVDRSRVPLRRFLRPWLEDRLPGYMVPDFFVELDEFPLTPNGKIDRKALAAVAVAREELEVKTKPRQGLEEALAEIWKVVLNLTAVDSRHAFFELGGNSMKILLVQQRIRRTLGMNVTVADLFKYPTIETLADYLGQGRKQNARSDDNEAASVDSKREDRFDPAERMSLVEIEQFIEEEFQTVVDNRR
jgi:amino acid adenylation domain-containing protein